jgi:indole-3-glycerol phosphate synthase
VAFLEKIYTLTQERVAAAKRATPPEVLRDGEFFSRVPAAQILDSRFRENDGRFNIIAEIKFASPSEGVIREGTNAVEIASGYLNAGAAMLSILTEPQYFKGRLDYLKETRRAHPNALLLRKDFMVDPYQLLEARAAGADAILLIVAMTPKDVTKKLFEEACALGLTALVETHDEKELEEALELGADFVGVNNRNLKTLKTDLEISRRLARMKPEDAAFICESGLSRIEDLREMRERGYDGFLMGTHFMKKPDPGAALRELLSCA